jgi:thymidylate synthase
MGHALLMSAVATSLGVELGTMMVSLAHPHLYEVHVQEAWDALGSGPSDDTITMPNWSIAEIEAEPEAYVAEVAAAAKEVKQPEYHTRPEVVA